MKPLVAHLDRIKELRHEHSCQFRAGDFSQMPHLDTKIKRAWEDFEVAKFTAFRYNVCFSCGGKPKSKFSVEAPAKLPMLFCSENCRLQFSVSLSLT